MQLLLQVLPIYPKYSFCKDVSRTKSDASWGRTVYTEEVVLVTHFKNILRALN